MMQRDGALAIKKLAAGIVGMLLCIGLATTSLNAHAEEQVSIGYQSSSTLLTLLHENGELDRTLKQQGVNVSWHQFTSGLPLLEALNTGAVDISADVADVVPIFALAAGAELTIYASETPSPLAQGLIVKADSSFHSVSDLKGKRIAVTKGAGNHYFLLSALQRAGLKPTDVNIAYLAPADARAAFEQGNVDAWIPWEPYLTLTEQALHVRTLASGDNGLADYQRLYLARTPFAKAHPEVLRTVYDALEKEGKWVKAHPQEAAKTLAPLWGNLNISAVEKANGHRSYVVAPANKNTLNYLQHMSDLFLRAGMLPHAIDTRDIGLWSPDH